MTILLNRRQILAGLLSLGAALTITTPVQKASKFLIDKEWQLLAENPWIFDIVNNSGTISESEEVEPSTYGDLVSISEADLATPEGLIRAVEDCGLLMQLFQWEGNGKLEEVRAQLTRERSALEPAKRRRLEALEIDLDNEEYGWIELVRSEGMTGLPRFRDIVKTWLAERIDWSQAEWLPKYSGAQGGAMGFFEQLSDELRQELGIEIVDGDQPGSSYAAAELRAGVDETNEKAKSLGLPFRFRDVS